MKFDTMQWDIRLDLHVDSVLAFFALHPCVYIVSKKFSWEHNIINFLLVINSMQCNTRASIKLAFTFSLSIPSTLVPLSLSLPSSPPPPFPLSPPGGTCFNKGSVWQQAWNIWCCSRQDCENGSTPVCHRGKNRLIPCFCTRVACWNWIILSIIYYVNWWNKIHNWNWNFHL